MDLTRPRSPPPTRCVSNRPCETARQWIRQQWCTWYFKWRTDDFGDEGYEQAYEHYELDGFGSASVNHDGSGPATGLSAAELTAGGGDAAGSVSQSASGKSGAANHDGSGCRSRGSARKRTDQVFIAAHSNCRNLPAEPDAGSAARTSSARRSLLLGTHGLERIDRPERLPRRQGQRHERRQ